MTFFIQSEKIRMLPCYPTILNLPYTNGTELGEEPIEVSHHKDLQPKKLTSSPDKMPPTPLDKMSPLPHNNATKATSFAPRFQKLLRINQKTLHAQKANYLRVTFQNVSNDYLADSRTLKCKISEIQITLC